MSERQQKVIELVRETIEEASGRAVDVTADTDLITSGFLDSLAVLQLFNKLQEGFGIELDVDDLTEANFGNAKSIANLIEERA